MGYQKNAVLLGRVSVGGGYRPPGPQMVELHRKSLRSGSKMGAGIATVPVRRAVPSRQIERGGGRVIPATLWDTELMTRTTSRGNCVSQVQIESESSKNATTRPRLDIWASEKLFLDYLRGISGPACLGTRSVTSSAASRARSSKPPRRKRQAKC